MWNWSDDHGVGTANPKQLVGFAFPNDDDVTAKDFPTLRKEVSDCFGVVFFEHAGRPYFTIPSWDKHQRTERKAKKDEALIAAAQAAVLAHERAEVGDSDDSGGFSDATQGDSGAGTGEREQGNRGTGEQGNRGTGEQGNMGTGDIPVGGEQSSPPEKQPSPFEQQVNDVTSVAYVAINKSANFMGLRGIAKWCLKDRCITGEQFSHVVTALYEMGKPITRQTVGQFLDGHMNKPGARKLTNAERALQELGGEMNGSLGNQEATHRGIGH